NIGDVHAVTGNIGGVLQAGGNIGAVLAYLDVDGTIQADGSITSVTAESGDVTGNITGGTICDVTASQNNNRGNITTTVGDMGDVKAQCGRMIGETISSAGNAGNIVSYGDMSGTINADGGVPLVESQTGVIGDDVEVYKNPGLIITAGSQTQPVAKSI